MNSIEYYNRNASRFFSDTFNADMSDIRNRFITCLPGHAVVLDAGCGPGRDVKAFREHGYEVYAMDASEAMVEYCRTIIGDRVKVSTFRDYDTDIKFDGIWACASLLHLHPGELDEVIKKFMGFLKPGGIFFMSFKYGAEDYIKDERYFNCQTEESVKEMLKISDNIKILDIFLTSDVREGRSDEKWVNLIIKKNPS